MTSRLEREFGDELYAAALRDQRRRRRSVRAFAAATFAVIGACVAIVWPNPAGAEVQVRFGGGRVEVHVGEGGVTPDDVLGALEDEGVDAEVVGLTTGPSGVGRFVRVTVEGGRAQPVVDHVEGTAFRTFSLPEDWDGDLVIGVGIATVGDEAYEALSDPFAPGEPLHCAGVLGHPLLEVRDRLDDLTVTVRAVDGDQVVEERPLADLLTTPRASWIVHEGRAVGPTTVSLTVVPASEVLETGCT